VKGEREPEAMWAAICLVAGLIILAFGWAR
jgi:hypothetical protein